MTDDDRRLALAEHYLDVGRPAEAYRVVLELGAPPGERGRLVLAESLRQLDRHDEAAEAARRGLEEEPFSAALLDSLCLSEQELGDVAAAERAVRSALDLQPDTPTLLCRYGHLLVRAGRLAEAGLLADEADRLAPDDVDAKQLRLALAYVAHGRSAAARIGTDVLALEPEDIGAHRSLAVAAAGRGDLTTATRHMEEVVRQDPTDAEASEVARDLRIASHWLLTPLWPFRRFSPWKVWAAMWLTVIPLSVLSPAAGASLLLAYILLVAYSWVVPPIVRAVLRRRSR